MFSSSPFKFSRILSLNYCNTFNRNDTNNDKVLNKNFNATIDAFPHLRSWMVDFGLAKNILLLDK